MTFKLKYNWQFRDEHYTSAYPAATDEDNNIFKIRGKNERGKTTTLKILAFAFGVIDDDAGNITQGILDEISDLEDGETTLTFDFIIMSPDRGLTLECSYYNKERFFKINGDDVGEVEVRDKFVVLFDVPEPLQEKLKNSIKNVRSRFRRYNDLVNSYNMQLGLLHTQMTEYNNAEKSKQKILETISNLESDLSHYKDLLNSYTNEEPNIRKQFVVYQYYKLTNDFAEAEGKCKEIESLIRKYQNRERKISNNGRNLLKVGNELRDMIYYSKELFISRIGIDSREKFNRVLNNVVALSDIGKLNEDILSNIYTFYLDQLEAAKKSQSSDVSDKSYKIKQELELIRKLLTVIKEYVNIDPEIPGSGKKITELLTPLQQREQELSNLVSDDESMGAIISKCNEIIIQIGNVTSELKKFKERRSDHEEEESEIDQESLKKQKEECDKKMDIASINLDKLQQEYDSISEAERASFRLDPNIVQTYDTLISNKKEFSDKISNTNINLMVQRESLKRYEDVSKPNTEMSMDDINAESKKLEELRKKLNSYTNKLQNIDLKKMQLREYSGGDGSELYSKIGEYLASVVEVIYHNKRPYEITNIDFSRGEYVLADGSGAIKFTRLGTGTRALNALLSKVRQNFQGKTKIILIDEIGDMDFDNQQILLNELKKQVRSGDALLAMLTERDDSSDVVSVVPIPLDPVI
jgi:hypothetical protein